MVIAGPVYLDSSALAKLYAPESENPALNLALLGRKDVLVADLALTAVVSALCRPESILRGMDALPLALALSAGAATMLSYDRRLRDAAAAAGLLLFPA